MVLAMGVLLLAGAQLKRWAWLTLQGGTVLGLLFIHWLFFESVYHIHALCPYCMVVWTVTIALFWYVLQYNLHVGHITLPAKIRLFFRKHHADILITWYVVITALILSHFWYYFGPLLHLT